MHLINLVLAAVFCFWPGIGLADTLVPDEARLNQIKARYGLAAVKRLRDWHKLIEQGRHLHAKEKLLRVNRFMNRVRFVSDRAHWGKKDYWSTPLEFLISNGGDCEDFTLAKYFTLRAMGIPASRMRMIYVKAKALNQAHMVLAYYRTPGSDPVILDNLVKRLKRGSQRPDLVPVYSFNGDYLWLAKSMNSRGELVGSVTRIGLWNRLRRRMLKEKTRIAVKR